MDRTQAAKAIAASGKLKGPAVIAEIEREVFGPKPPDTPYEPLISQMVMPGTEHHIYKFPNGYGASVIRGRGSYGGQSGLWELAVIKITGPRPDDWSIARTRLTRGDTVTGWLSAGELAGWLKRIARMKGNYPLA